MTTDSQLSPIADWPAYWFIALEQARERGDSRRAAEAKRELERLGAKVTFRRPRREAMTQ